MNERISFWLIPAEPDKTYFAQIISKLAHRFAAPLFEPHMTLYSGPAPVGDVETMLAVIARECDPITLHATGVSHSPEFTKTVFLQFATNDRLRKISEQFRQRCSPDSPYTLNPHLSLIYATLDAGTREGLAQEFTYPKTIRFNQIKAVATGSVNRFKADVESWHDLAMMNLNDLTAP